MFPSTSRVVPNRTRVTGAEVDEIVILAHLGTGTYYSMAGSARVIWSLIEREEPVQAIVSALQETYDVDAPQAEADVARLLAELAREALVVPGTDDGAPGHPAPTPSTGTAPRARQPYESPLLEIFAGLSPLLANDPPMLIPPFV